MAGKVSKNAREGVRKATVNVAKCGKGHVLERVLVVPGFKGRKHWEWWCPCSA